MISSDTPTPSTSESETSNSVYVNYEAFPYAINGFLYDDNLLVNGLQITNVDTGDVHVICNVPGCLHRTSDAECMNNRYMIDNDFSAAYQDHVVFVGLDKQGNLSSSSMYYVNSDGSALKTLISWKGYDTIHCSRKVLVDNHLFFTVSLEKSSINEDGYVTTDEVVVHLYDVDMEAGSIQLLYESDAAYNANIFQGGLYSDGLLCMEYEIQTLSFEEMGISEQEYYEHYDEYFDDRVELQGLKVIVVIYDLNTGKYEELDFLYDGKEIAVDGFMDRKLFSYTDTHKVLCYDLDTKNFSYWREDLSVNSLYQSTDFILIKLMPPAVGEVTTYMILQAGSEQLKSFSPEEYNFMICDECPERLQIQQYIGSDSLGNYISLEPEYIDRKTFLSWFS
jgi:hypothetical protein